MIIVSPHRIVLAFRLLLLLLLPGPSVFAQAPSTSSWIDPLTPSERRGWQIYHQGTSGGEEPIRVRVGGADSPLPGSLFRCVQCHGRHGQGSEEGGLRVPPLTRASLRHPHRSPQTGREQPAYTDETLARAITTGQAADGEPLHPSMPRYELTAHDLTALLDYVNKLGTEDDLDPGLTSDTIFIGTTLPLSGVFAPIGQDVRAVLDGFFALVNAQGGLYGRQLRLVVKDSGSDPVDVRRTTATALADEGLFAIVSAFELGWAHEPSDQSARPPIPQIGPLTLSPPPADSMDPMRFYLLPGFDIQFRVLIDALHHHSSQLTGTTNPSLAIVQVESEMNRATAQAIRRQAGLHDIRIVADIEYANEMGASSRPLEPLVEQLVTQQPDVLAFIGPGKDLVVLGSALARRQVTPVLLTSRAMIGAQWQELSASLRPQLRMAAPLNPMTAVDLTRLTALADGHQLQSFGYTRMAEGAASLLLRALQDSGRQVRQATLIETLEQVRNVEIVPDLVVSFGPDQRIGSLRARIFAVAPDGDRLTPMTDWLAPESVSNEEIESHLDGQKLVR